MSLLGSPLLLELLGAPGFFQLPRAACNFTCLPAHTTTALAGETKQVHMHKTAKQSRKLNQCTVNHTELANSQQIAKIVGQCPSLGAALLCRSGCG